MAADLPKPPVYRIRLGAPAKSGFTPAPAADRPVREILDAAVAAHGVGRFDEAERLYRLVLAREPDEPNALTNLGTVFLQRGRVDEGTELIECSLAIKPAQSNALTNLGNVLVAQRRYAEAVERLEAAVALDPQNAGAFSNLGNARAELGQVEAADAAFERAIALRPGFTQAQLNRASLLRNHGRHADAEAIYDAVLAAEPGNAEAAFEKGTLRLLLAGGNDPECWRLFEARWRKVGFEKSANRAFKPVWLGGPEIAGKTVVLHTEQGVGDTLQMLRYVPAVVARAARVVLVVPPQLVELARSAAAGALVLPMGAALPSHDLFCPLMSLPLATGELPDRTPYLSARPETVAVWRERLGPPTGRPRIGLVWSGNPAHLNDHRRSLPLAALAPLLDRDAELFSLQVGRREAVLDPRIRDLAPDLRSFDDTAAAIGELDHVVTADTSVAHLAGALGRPVSILLPYAPDYRWGFERATTAWYPSARLYRQPAPGDWTTPIAQLGRDL